MANGGVRSGSTVRWSRGSSTGSGPGSLGVICPGVRALADGVEAAQRFSLDGTWDRIHTRLLAEADAAGEIDWTASVDSTINRAHQHSTNSAGSNSQPATLARHGRPAPRLAQGAGWNHTNLGLEPLDHAIGRSRGGLVDQDPPRLRRQAAGPGDAARRPARAATPRCSRTCWPRSTYPDRPGRPRTRPDRVAADKAYSSRGNRALLRSRGIIAVIPEPGDQIGHRQRRGSKRRTPPSPTTPRHTAAATWSNVPSTSSSNGADWPPATTSSPSPTEAESSWHQSPSGCANRETRPRCSCEADDPLRSESRQCVGTCMSSSGSSTSPIISSIISVGSATSIAQ